MLKNISNRLFAKVRVPLIYSMPVILVVFALSTGYMAIVLLEAVLPKNPMIMSVDVFTIRKLISIIKVLTILYIFLALIVGILISRKIHDSVTSVVNSYENIISGLPVKPVDVLDTGDEMQELTENFNKIVSRLNSYILDSLMGCTIVLDNNMSVLSMNSAARNTLKIDEEMNIHKNINNLLGSENANNPFIELIQASLDEKTISSSKEIPYKPPDSEWMTLGLTTSVLKNDKDEHVGLFIVFKDLTKIEEIRLQMQRTEKMVSLGRMSAGIAHEIRNPLGSIKGLTQLLLERSPDDEKVQRYTGVMIKEIERLDNVVKSLLNFSSPNEQKFEECNVNDILKDAINLVGYERTEESARLEEDYDTSAPPIMAERERLLQAVLNILINAFAACGPNDRISIKTHFKPEQFHFNDNADSDGVEIEISNTGPPIPQKEIEKIFDPFFTTKTEGSGLGLAITQQIVSAHNGNLKVESSEGLTRFRIELPIATQNV